MMYNLSTIVGYFPSLILELSKAYDNSTEIRIQYWHGILAHLGCLHPSCGPMRGRT